MSQSTAGVKLFCRQQVDPLTGDSRVLGSAVALARTRTSVGQATLRDHPQLLGQSGIGQVNGGIYFDREQVVARSFGNRAKCVPFATRALRQWDAPSDAEREWHETEGRWGAVTD